MLKSAILILTPFLIHAAQAGDHSPVPGAIYAKGAQPVGIAGETADCFVETVFTNADQNVRVRALVAEPHDPDQLIGLGPVFAEYEAQNQAYGYIAADADASLRALSLAADAPASIQGLSALLQHGNHADTLSCKNLNVLQGAELAQVQHLFAHFDEYVEDGHDHDHGQDEDHDHGDDHDHGHGHP